MRAIVTIKLPYNPAHDSHNKMLGRCVTSEICTDVTGSHHSYLTTGKSLESIREEAEAKYGHVTRIEMLPSRSLEYDTFMKYITVNPMPSTELREGEQVITIYEFAMWRDGIHQLLLSTQCPWEFTGGDD